MAAQLAKQPRKFNKFLDRLEHPLSGRTRAHVLQQVCTQLPELPFLYERYWYHTLVNAMNFGNNDLIRFLLRANKYLANASGGFTVSTLTGLAHEKRREDPQLFKMFKAAGGKMSFKERTQSLVLSKKGAVVAAGALGASLVGMIYRGRKQRNEDIKRAIHAGKLLKKLGDGGV